MMRAQYTVFKYFLFFVALCFALMSSEPLYAQNAHRAAKLNDENISAFITELTDMASGAQLESSPQQVAAFLDMHLHPSARFKSSIEYIIPGNQAQKKSMALSKAQFMESVAAGPQAVQDYSNRVNVKSVKVSSDGRKATIETRGIESGMMAMPDQNGNIINIPMEGFSDCQQIIMLNDDDIMQIYNANCTTTVNFSES